jgi:hypothetical protein
VIQQKENFPLKNWEIVSINPNNKNWNWKDLFCFWGNNVKKEKNIYAAKKEESEQND